MFRILLLIGLLLISIGSGANISHAQTLSSTTSIFRDLGIELLDPIADRYYVGDAILIRGRVTDSRAYALIYLKNITTGESISELADTSTTGEFSYPLPLPLSEGNYSLVIASGNSFNTTIHYTIELVANKTPPVPVTSESIRPIFVPTPSPYLSIGPDLWANMTIEQGRKIYKTQGKILSLAGLSLQYGPARISLQGYRLTSPSSLDRSTASGASWTGSVYIDRTRDRIGRDAVSLRVLRSVATMQLRIPQGKKVKSDYYLTTPSGDVIEGKFAPQYIASDGYLKNGINIRQSFSIMENGVYKIEAVSNNGYAYFNLPISRSQFYSVVVPVSDTDRDILRSDLSSVTTSVLASINIVRRGLGRPAVSIDPILANLAQAKATDMATYNYVGHTTHDGLDIIEFATSKNISVIGTIGENVAGGNVSDKSLQDGLEESGSHRSNMIDLDWGHVGIGYVLRNGRTYLVQIFGK
ncbi:hypothetical protein H7170_00395 [Candidatus Gracilibacteria bacterium]|nr:hypothetical protein [Candidatus Gracilibacteria bacterium]